MSSERRDRSVSYKRSEAASSSAAKPALSPPVLNPPHDHFRNAPRRVQAVTSVHTPALPGMLNSPPRHLKSSSTHIFK